MNHLAAALLLALAKKEINEKNVNDIFAAAGSKSKPEEVKKLVAKCKGKDYAALVKEGMTKLSTMGAGSAEPVKADDKKKEEPKGKKKEEPKKKEEKPAEDDGDEGIGDLF